MIRVISGKNASLLQAKIKIAKRKKLTIRIGGIRKGSNPA